MKKLGFFLVALFMLSNTIFGQILTIVDTDTKEPLKDVALISNQPNLYASTNEKGQVDLAIFAEASVIQIILSEYQTVKKSYNELAASNTLQLSPLAFSFDAVTVTASKWNDNNKNQTSRTTSLAKKEVQLQNPQTTADLLGGSGEVFIQKSQLGGGSPMIRGFSTNRLLYVVDGVRMNNATFRGGNLQNVISLDAFSLDKTDILFGPSSVMYGSDALGAVMSFTTLQPQLSLTDKPLIVGSATTRYSSASSEKTMHVDFNVGFKKWAFVSSFSTNDFGDLKMGSFGPDEYLRPFYVKRIDSLDVVVTNDDPRIQTPTGYTQMNLMQKIQFKPTKYWQFDYGFHYSETSSYSRYDRHVRLKNGLPRYAEWSYGPQKWMMNNFSIAHTKKNVVYDRMSLRFAQQSFEESRISRDMNKADRLTTIEYVYAYSANLDFNKSLGKKNTLNYGAEAVLNDVVSRGFVDDIVAGTRTEGFSRYPQSTWSSIGVYLTDQFRVNEKLTLNGGVRYNQYTIDAVFQESPFNFPFTTANLSNGATTGSIGVVYRPTDKWNISGSVSTAFRSPNVDDVGKVFDSEPGSVIIPNPNLEAEYAYNAELGISKIFGDVLKLDVTGYYTLLENALVRRDFILNGEDSIDYNGTLSQVQAIQNAAVARIYGIQAGFDLSIAPGLMLSSRINYQKGEEELDNGDISPSRHAPPTFGITRLSYRYHGFKIEVNAQYMGEASFEELPEEEKAKDYIYAIDENGNPYSPAWCTFNLKGMYQFTPNFNVGFGVENLTDLRYRTYSSGIVAPGRNFILSLKANF